jgi:hypothetical protein
MARPKKAKEAPERIPPSEALRLLLPELSAREAALQLSNKCRLWCNDNLLPADYVANSLRVVARTDANRRWRADVVSSVREAWEDKVYNFEFDAEEVRALLRRAEAHAPSAAEPPAPRRHKPGPKIKKNWKLRVAGECDRIMRKEGRRPSAPELAQFCENETGYQPDVSEINKLLHVLLDE